MKTVLLSLLAALSFSAFAGEEVSSLTETARNRFFCYYKDSAMGYTHGAGSSRLGTAKGRARATCEQALRNYDLHGTCTFVGCREVNNFEMVD